MNYHELSFHDNIGLCGSQMSRLFMHSSTISIAITNTGTAKALESMGAKL